MFKLLYNEIYQTCGNTGGFTIRSLWRCAFPDGYEAVFTVKRNLNDREPVLVKHISGGRIILQESDTALLPPGNYWYDIEIRVPDKNGGITQVATIGPYRYHLFAPVTYKGGEIDE